MRLRLLAMLVLLLPAGCQPATRPERARLESSPYYPLAIGTTWVYRGPGGERIMRVARHESVDGVQCALVETLSDGKLIEENDVCIKPDGIYIVVADGQKLSSPLPILKLPPRAGTTWRINFNKGSKHSQGVYLMGLEDVEVPAGKFHTITLQGEIRKGRTPTVTSIYWFAKGVGIVKQFLKTGDRKTTYELESFEMGHPGDPGS